MKDIHAYHILLIGEDPEPDPETRKVFDDPEKPVVYASSISEALSKLLETPARVIVIDIARHMARAFETANVLRSSERFKAIPILFLLPENPFPDWAGQDISGGVVDYLVKPLNRFLINQRLMLLEQVGGNKGEGDEETREALNISKLELENANAELQRLTEDLEDAIEKANQMAVEAEMATISKSSFLATMSHEIRTPLNAVIGFTELVLGTPLSDEQAEYIESIRSASNTFLELINDILDYSKIEAEMIQLESIPFGFETCIQDVMGTMWMRAFEKGLGLAYRISPDVPGQVEGDPVRFKQIIVNLLGNAIKFTDQGQIILRLEQEQLQDARCMVHLTVSDSGIGIPESKWPLLFQPFCQAAESTSREFGGTGLGLAISKKLADQMNGSIWIQSPNPESSGSPGTVFHVLLAFKRAEQPVDEIPLPRDGGGRRVLLCEKDAVLARLYSDILYDSGMDVVSAQELSELSNILGEQQKAGEPVTDILLDDPHGTVDTGSLQNHVTGRIIILETPGVHEPETPVENEYGRVVRIRKPLKNDALIKSLVNNDEYVLNNERNDSGADLNAAPCQSLKILLVEDNKINQKVTLKMLDRMGHQALLAENGKQALEVLETQKDVDVILMDGQMPVMDGFQTTELIRIKERDKGVKTHIPIIALTANAMKGDRKKYIDSGMDDYIAKPVKISDLSDVIKRVRQLAGQGISNGTPNTDRRDMPEF